MILHHNIFCYRAVNPGKMERYVGQSDLSQSYVQAKVILRK